MCVICESYHRGTLPVGLISTQVGDVVHIGLAPNCTPEARSFLRSLELQNCRYALVVMMAATSLNEILDCEHPSPCEEPECLGYFYHNTNETEVRIFPTTGTDADYGFGLTFTLEDVCDECGPGSRSQCPNHQPYPRLNQQQPNVIVLEDCDVVFSLENVDEYVPRYFPGPYIQGDICDEVAPMTPTEILGVITEWTQLTVDDINQLAGLGNGIVLHNGSYRPISRDYRLPGWDEEE